MAFSLVFVIAVLGLTACAAGDSPGASTKDECNKARVVVTSMPELREEVTNAMHSISGFRNDTMDNIPMEQMTEKIIARIESGLDAINQSQHDSVSQLIEILNAVNQSLQNKLDAVNQSMEHRFVAVNRKLDSLERRMNELHGLGLTSWNAASSCSEILETAPASPSGYYWVSNSTGYPQSVYCDMTRSCGGVTGGWMRVAYLDMTNSSHQCPSGLTQRTDSGVRSCATTSDNGPTCSSVLYSSLGIHYSRVCGKIIAYQDYSMDGFYSYSPERRNTIDSNYVDGVSLTRGSPHREHIWTFVAGPCPEQATRPPFIRNDFFHDDHRIRRLNVENSLWDGEGCTNTCCHHNNPPWFHRQLPRPTTDNIEMRVCRDQERSDEDLGIKVVEIYLN